MARPDIKPLTGLRGVAALWIVLYHLLLPARLVGGPAAAVIGRGYLAVDVFFLLSGFVLALNYGALFRGGIDTAAFGAFLWKRVARLYPLYGTILIARLAYTACRYGGFNLPRAWIAAPVAHPWLDIPANLLMVQSWGMAPSLIGPAWSISTEWAAYWMFPLLAVAMLHSGRGAALACAAGASALLLATMLLLAGTTDAGKMLDAWDGQTPGPLMRCIGGFTLGIFLWRLAGWKPAARLAGHTAAIAGTLLTLAGLLAAGAPDPALYPALATLVLCLASAKSGPAAAFGWAPVVWLGEISYSLYLLHIFLLHPIDLTRAALRVMLPPGPSDAITILATLAFLLAASDTAYRWVERPGRTALRRLGSSRNHVLRVGGYRTDGKSAAEAAQI